VFSYFSLPQSYNIILLLLLVIIRDGRECSVMHVPTANNIKIFIYLKILQITLYYIIYNGLSALIQNKNLYYRYLVITTARILKHNKQLKKHTIVLKKYIYF